jgi:hypothetical protein
MPSAAVAATALQHSLLQDDGMDLAMGCADRNSGGGEILLGTPTRSWSTPPVSGGGGGGATPAVPRRLLRALSERLQPGMSAEDHLTLSPWEKFKQHRCGGQGVPVGVPAGGSGCAEREAAARLEGSGCHTSAALRLTERSVVLAAVDASRGS